MSRLGVQRNDKAYAKAYKSKKTEVHLSIILMSCSALQSYLYFSILAVQNKNPRYVML